MTTLAKPYLPQRHPFGATYTEGPLAAIAMFFKEFLAAAFNPYHPERHYMRGPGPACRARQRGQEVLIADGLHRSA